MSEHAEHGRSAGDDVVVQVRVRRANLPALEQGITLGTDALTRGEIQLRLVPRDDGIHDLEVITNALSMANAPEPVDAEVDWSHAIAPGDEFAMELPRPGYIWEVVNVRGHLVDYKAHHPDGQVTGPHTDAAALLVMGKRLRT